MSLGFTQQLWEGLNYMFRNNYEYMCTMVYMQLCVNWHTNKYSGYAQEIEK
jgi:hypothetical protein